MVKQQQGWHSHKATREPSCTWDKNPCPQSKEPGEGRALAKMGFGTIEIALLQVFQMKHQKISISFWAEQCISFYPKQSTLPLLHLPQKQMQCGGAGDAPQEPEKKNKSARCDFTVRYSAGPTLAPQGIYGFVHKSKK